MSVHIANNRREARETGAPYYWGTCCKYGHTPLRYPHGSCVQCASERRERYRNDQREYARQHYKANRADYLKRAEEWKRNNPDLRREVANAYVKRYPAKALAAVRKRQAAKLQRTPAWADLKAIEAFYIACPEGFQVDHVVPLRGRRVSGLHVLHNLQYLPKHENMAKGNRHESDQ